MWITMHHVILFSIGLCVCGATRSDAVEGDIRLTDDDTKHGIGRVEIYHDNQWGSICNDYWDIDDANVVCRQLGYPSAVGVSKTTKKGSRSMPIWLDNVRCDGIESELIECAHNGWGNHNCDPLHSEDASVQCQVESVTGDLYLKSSSGHTETDVISGYLHRRLNSNWNQVCDPHWGITESHVVCRQLGYVAATYTHAPDDDESGHLMTSVKCAGTEDRLEDCQHGEWRENCHNAVFVACATKIQDSSADALYHPENYCEKQFTSDDYNQLTLDFFRNSTDLCDNGIPANIKCTKDGKDSTEFPGTVCDRRLGFICNGNVGNCKGFDVRIKCPCTEEEPGLSGKCVHNQREYSAGEKRNDDKGCRACTCVFRGGEYYWLCDDDDMFCPKDPLPPFESMCYRENCDEPRVCNLGTWFAEWFIAGMSPFCEKCLFKMDTLNDTYDGRELEECPDCIVVDGVTRPVAVVNRKIPGPIVHVCEGDRVIVKLVNQMNKESASGITIHWHGMHQKGTQYMDGAFMVTQCPIPIGEAFTYNFTASPAGTHWWHSHAGQQRSEGLYGGLIVRQSKDKDPNGHTYDFDRPEHTIVLQDWANDVAVSRVIDTLYGKFTKIYNPASILINGRGGQSSYRRAKFCRDDEDVNDVTDCPVPRYTQFDVSPKKRYRFRVISSGVRTMCAFRVSIDQHEMLIIAVDGTPVEPYEVTSFIIFSGERYDFVLDAVYDSGDYWMRVEGQYKCDYMNDTNAIIHYDNRPVELPTSVDDSSSGPKVDPCEGLGVGDFTDDGQYLAQLNLHPNVSSVAWPEPDEIFFIEQTFTDSNSNRYGQFNNFTSRPPKTPFLLQDSKKGKIETCSMENDKENGQSMIKQCGDGWCECTHVIHVPQGKVVEMVFVNHLLDRDSEHFCHPNHLHGQHFRVVADGRFDSKVGVRSTTEYVKMMMEQGKIKRKDHSKAILKDTLVTPINGYTIVQFKADNPGYWFLHCHYELHLEEGMMLVIHVDGDLPEKPESFPECGAWPVLPEDGEVFHWSETFPKHVGTVGGELDTNNTYFLAVRLALENSRPALEERLKRKFDKFQVTNNKLKTDPVAGFHSYLFKISTGDGWYIHVQFKAKIDYVDSPKPYIVACVDGLSDEQPLMAIKPTSLANKCKHPVNKIPPSSFYTSNSQPKARSKASKELMLSAKLFIICILPITFITGIGLKSHL